MGTIFKDALRRTKGVFPTAPLNPSAIIVENNLRVEASALTRERCSIICGGLWKPEHRTRNSHHEDHSQDSSAETIPSKSNLDFLLQTIEHVLGGS
jgi:hypothetical protein